MKDQLLRVLKKDEANKDEQVQVLLGGGVTHVVYTSMHDFQAVPRMRKHAAGDCCD